MRAPDPARLLFWSCGQDVMEPEATDTGSVLIRMGRPLPRIAAETRLTGLLSDLAEATERDEAERALYLARAVNDLTEALRVSGQWARAFQPIARRRAA